VAQKLNEKKSSLSTVQNIVAPKDDDGKDNKKRRKEPRKEGNELKQFRSRERFADPILFLLFSSLQLRAR
jgi:hypothetical protein